ncbi:MAG: hypothetical protein QOD75_3330 [Blastocatellia bacterium]|jgi:hypothetical protein|nr:hypothetical protein [Blastocatellia bacterium]
MVKEMTYISSINISNASDKEIIFSLEPWGEQIKMPVGSKFNVVAKSEQEGSFEVEYGEREIIVWAWPSSIVKVFCDGKGIGNESGIARPAVPGVPEGQTTSSFLRSMLGKE